MDDFIGEGERFGAFDVGFERFEGFVGGRGREDRIVGEIGYDFVDIGVCVDKRLNRAIIDIY